MLPAYFMTVGIVLLAVMIVAFVAIYLMARKERKDFEKWKNERYYYCTPSKDDTL